MAFRMASVVFLCCLMMVAGTTAASAQQNDAKLESANRKIPRQIPKALNAIKVDGALDEADWQSSLSLELNYEVQPGENITPKVRTECLLIYDDSQLYAAFRAADPNPSSIRARFSDRDRAFRDDFVGIVIDTFNDERRAFEFFVNPLGVQMDLIVDDVSGNEDPSWDTIWESAGKITAEGYVVELAIPYTSLRFQRGSGEQIWGLDIVRVYPRDHRYLIALSPRDRNVSCYLCQTAKIQGFEGATPGKNLDLSPTSTAIRTDEINDFPHGNLQKGDPDFELGLTTRWGITPNLTLAGALNPDFSQVEADIAQLNINEQFALFFPEKRPFFLEGADFFETPLSAVYTRTAANPSWGVKLTGKEGKSAIGVFVARDELTNLLIPGSQSSSFEFIDEASTAGVLRYRRDVGGNSALGGLLTARATDGYHNLAGGVDGLWRLKPTDTFRFQFLGSQTEYPQSISAADEQDDHAFFLSYNHSPRNWTARASYEDIGKDFRADLGFMPQADFRKAIIGGEYRWWGDRGDWYSRITVGGDWDQTEEQDGSLIEREIEGVVTVGGPMQSFFLIDVGHRTRVFNAVSFRQDFANLFFEFQPIGNLYINTSANFADAIDFSATRPGQQLRITPEMRVTLGKHLRLDLRHEYRDLDLDAGKLFRANLSQMKLVYQFNVRAFVRAILQHTDISRNVDLYTSDVEPKSRHLFSQFLFSYKINPQTALYLGYSDNRAGLEEVSLTRTDRTFFFKIGYAWVL